MRYSLIIPAACILSLGFASGALAHAQLQSASPSVGGSVAGSPSEIRLEFSEAIEAAFSHVALSSASGQPVAVLKPSNGGAKSSLVVHLGQKLKPGRYHVQWNVLSVDTHKTQGSFSFEVRP